MRNCVALLLMSLAMTGSAAKAEIQSVSFVHLFTTAPEGVSTALYNFSFTSDQNDFKSATVSFIGGDGQSYGCGVFAFASCTYKAGGQMLKLVGLANGFRGEYLWKATAALPRPAELVIAMPGGPGIADSYVSEISIPAMVPEPSSWGLMLAGFGLVGTAMRRRPAAQAVPIT
jgi:hypothetical protein